MGTPKVAMHLAKNLPVAAGQFNAGDLGNSLKAGKSGWLHPDIPPTKLTAILRTFPPNGFPSPWNVGQICEAGVRFRKMLITLETLSLYCGSPLNFFHTGASKKLFQCCLWAS